MFKFGFNGEIPAQGSFFPVKTLLYNILMYPGPVIEFFNYFLSLLVTFVGRNFLRQLTDQ